MAQHTRKLRRRYAEAGMLETSIAMRDVWNEFSDVSDAERELYEAVESCISERYNKAAATERGRSASS